MSTSPLTYRHLCSGSNRKQGPEYEEQHPVGPWDHFEAWEVEMSVSARKQEHCKREIVKVEVRQGSKEKV